MNDRQRYSVITIEPSEVDLGPEAPFRVRRHLPGEPGEIDADRLLIESAREHGLLRPPLFVTGLDQCGESPLLVQGYRRCAAARAAGLETIEAMLFTVTEDQFAAAFLQWIEDFHYGEPLSELEKILLTKKTRELDTKTPLTLLSNAYGKTLSAEHLENLLRILELDDPVLEALHRGDVSTGDLLTLMNHTFVDIDDAVRILSGERLTRSDQKKAVRLMLRIGDCGEERWKKFASSCNAGSGALLDTLNRTVHPTLTKDLERIGTIIRNMHLPPSASITPPENMEGGSYRLQVGIRDEHTLEQTLDKLKDAIDNKMIVELLKILRSE
jgi:ParB/RepB/Spo0J family partition protein